MYSLPCRLPQRELFREADQILYYNQKAEDSGPADALITVMSYLLQLNNSLPHHPRVTEPVALRR